MIKTRYTAVVVAVVFIVTFAGGAVTYAQFSDTETATGSFTAGTWNTPEPGGGDTGNQTAGNATDGNETSNNGTEGTGTAPAMVQCGFGQNNATGVGQLTIQYNGDGQVTVGVGKNKNHLAVEKSVQPDGEFTVTNGPNINSKPKFYVNGERVAKLDIGCSDGEPLGPGTTFGNGLFTVIAGEDKDGNKLAPVPDSTTRIQASVARVGSAETVGTQAIENLSDETDDTNNSNATSDSNTADDGTNADSNGDGTDIDINTDDNPDGDDASSNANSTNNIDAIQNETTSETSAFATHILGNSSSDNGSSEDVQES